MNTENRLSWALCLLRLSVFLVMLMWTLDKFVRPGHATGVFEHFYPLSGVGISTIRVLGALELLLLLGFVAGVARRFTYGAVLLLHASSTFASWQQYAHLFEDVNLLFFAAWPMLAACIALYLLRDADSMTVGGRPRAARTR